MKNVFKLFGVIALVAIIGFSMAACSDGGGGGGGGPDPVMHTITFDANGGTIDGTATKDIQVEDGKKVKMPNDPVNSPKIFWGWFDNKTPPYGNIFTGTIPVTADKTVYARWDDTAPPEQFDVTFDANGGKFEDGKTTQVIKVYRGDTVIPPWATNGDYMVSGWNTQADGNGTAFDKDEPITAALTVYAQWKKPEDMPVKDRWGKWIEPGSTATLEYSVDDDGVCTITVGGAAQPNNETDNWGRWKAQAIYFYTAKAGKSYTYKFEARTESGTRKLSFQYLTDNEKEIYKSREILLTNEPQTYTVYGGLLSKDAENHVEFQCADQLGTFYVKMLEIKEYIMNPGNEPFTNIDEMTAWLDSQPDNTAATAYTIKLNISGDLGGDIDTPGSVGYVLKGSGKYVNLDLSGSTITSINVHAFFWYTNLTGITIPDSVTSIWDQAFAFCLNLTAINVASGNTNYSSEQGVLYNKDKTTLVAYPGKKSGAFTIPNSVTSIEGAAFQCCQSLTGITIPNSVESIGYMAFQYCAGLTSVAIPDSVTDIDGGAFAACGNLTAINVGSGNTNYSSEQGILYNKSKTTLMQYPAGKTGSSFAIPNSVTSIGVEAFMDCKNLISITIPNGVTSIGSYAFESCTSLTSIIIPASVTSIDGGAFGSCSSLTSVIFQGTIAADSFGFVYDDGDGNVYVSSPFDGDLRDKFYADDEDNGTPGTYTRTSGSSTTWTKQP
jgi:hypothetical protein